MNVPSLNLLILWGFQCKCTNKCHLTQAKINLTCANMRTLAWMSTFKITFSFTTHCGELVEIL